MTRRSLRQEKAAATRPSEVREITHLMSVERPLKSAEIVARSQNLIASCEQTLAASRELLKHCGKLQEHRKVRSNGNGRR